MADIDPQLDNKKRARRRLVGASALFLVAVVVLPMVMDQEPLPLSEDIQIRIPNPDATAAFSQVAPIKAPEASAAKPTSATGPGSAEIDSGSLKADTSKTRKPADAAPVKVDIKPDTKPEPKPESKPKVETKAEAKPADKPGVVAEPKAPISVEPVAKPDKTDKPTKADKPEKSDKPAAAGEFFVALGTFSDADNARRVRMKAKGLGVDSYLESIKTDQGERTRVRAGPFPDRALAEKARAKLAETGVSAVVTVK